MQDQIINFLQTLGPYQTAAEKNLLIFRAKGEGSDPKSLPNPASDPEPKIFLILHQNTDPLRLEVGTDEKLAKLLKTRYESVMTSKNITPKEWIEIICSGQLTEAEILDLIRLSYLRALLRG